MDNELSTSVMIAVELIVLSAVVGIIMLFAGIGQQFQRTTLESINNVVAASYGSEIEVMCENNGLLPTATVYLMLEKNTDVIESISGSIIRTFGDGTYIEYSIDDKDDLLDFFDTKVKTSAIRKTNDMYEVTVESNP